MSKKDTLYRSADLLVKPFQFNQKVVDVFPDMIDRSVPGYPLTISMISIIANAFAQAGSNIYDLGCSLGAVSIAIQKNIDKKCNIIAIDNSSAMINACHNNIPKDKLGIDIKFILQDIRQTAITDASMVVMNFTLQFIPIERRLALLKKIYAGLLPGGVFILSEKVIFADIAETELLEQLHQQMKLLNGYEKLEIANKRQALEDVLFPETIATHQERLKIIGFQDVLIWLKCFNFISLLAIK